MNKFWNFTESDGSRVLELNGVIAEESWFDDDVTPEMFRKELENGTGNITVWLNSPGGDCIAASRIYAMLRDYAGEVTVKIDGMAASAASVVAMAGDTVLMAPTAMMMIHNPLTKAWGNRNAMQKAIELLDEFKESIINAYELKTGLSRAKLSRLMEEETWMNAKKAIELGFADGMTVESEGEAYSFSAASVSKNLMNKAAKSAAIKAEGARVSDLRKALYDKLLTI